MTVLPGVGPHTDPPHRPHSSAPVAGSARQRHASVAVLPFESLSSDPDLDYLAEGLSGELRSRIGLLPGMDVAARDSSRVCGARAMAGDDIAVLLDAGAVLSGTVKRIGARVQVGAQLVQSTDGSRLWSDRYDRDHAELIAIENAIVRAVAGRLAPPSPEPASFVRRATAEGYDWYLRGRSGSGLRRLALERRLECFERATANDVDFAPAQAGLASTAVALVSHGFVPVTGLAARGRAAGQRAVQAGGPQAEAQVALAELALLVDWDADAAGRAVARAIADEPRRPEAHAVCAIVSACAGRAADAVAAARRTVDLDPLSAAAFSVLARVHVLLRQPADAIAAGERAVSIDADHVEAHRALAAAHVISGDLDAARPELDQAMLLSRRHQWCVSELAVVCAGLGDMLSARALHDELVRRSAQEYVQRHVLAQTSAAFGRLEDALQLLDQAAKLREPLPLVRHSPYFGALLDHPRFHAIVG